jgi:hypothetical protein
MGELMWELMLWFKGRTWIKKENEWAIIGATTVANCWGNANRKNTWDIINCWVKCKIID